MSFDNERRFRNALLWTFERMSVDGGMTPAETRRTIKEISNVLQGRHSVAAEYEPEPVSST